MSGARATASPSSMPIRKPRASSACRASADLSSPTRSSLIFRPLSPRSQAEASRRPHRALRRQGWFRDRARDRVQEARRRRQARQGRRPRFRSRPRRCGDRRHHELHQHVEPLGAHCGRPARPQRRREGPHLEAWVKTSLAPGSQVVAAYLEKCGLQPYLDKIGFNLVGFGCTTCIGNSGPLPAEISKTINDNGLVAAACSPATATSKAASRPTFRRIISPPRRSSSLCLGRQRRDRFASEPLGTARTASPST